MNDNEANQIKYKITIDPRKVSSKPDDEYHKTITSHLTEQIELKIDQFLEIVSPPYSFTWSPGLFAGTRTNASWIEQSIFALDFDKGTISVEQVYLRLNEFGIVPQLYYYTFSDSILLRKFRVVLFLDTPVTDIRIHKMIYQSLFSMFPDVDINCKDASRYFLGGKECKVVHIDPISTSGFVDAMSIYAMTRDSNSMRKIPLDSSYYSGLKSAEKREILLDIYRSSRIPANDLTPPPTSIERGLIEKFDFDQARQKVRILDEFLSGSWLYHNEVFGLATNMIHIKGGIKLMKDTMKKYNESGQSSYTQNNYNSLTYAKRVNYSPQPIYKFSPYEEDDDLLDLVSATMDIRGFIEILEPINRIDLAQAEDLLKSKYKDVIENGQVGKIYLFKLPTAIGKTQSILNTTGVTIAFPTNSLKNEIGQRMGAKYNSTPDPVVLEDDRINKKMEYFYAIGLSKKAMRILHHIVNPLNSKFYSRNDIITAEKYLQGLETSIASADTILTTHKRALHTVFKHDTIIYDEDPLNSLLEKKELNISDLLTLNFMVNISGLDRIIDFLRDCPTIPTFKTPFFKIDVDQLIDSLSSVRVESNIVDFLASSFFSRDDYNKDIVNYVVKKDLPKDKKVIIMSATLPIYIYKKLYGDRIEVIDLTNVEQQGTITQHTKRSCSRQGLRHYAQKISEEVGDKPVITFKDFGHHFKNPVKGMYFGNCSGYDSMKGQDMAVVGTFHRNPLEYYLTASVLGIDLRTTDTTMSHQKIEYNGFRFKFNCFDHEELRQIQLSLIESDLIQAVGRARTLRTTAHVDLYSNFPLKIADEFRY